MAPGQIPELLEIYCTITIGILLKSYTRNETFDQEMRLLIGNGKFEALELLFKYVNLDYKDALEYCLSISKSYNISTRCIKLLEDSTLNETKFTSNRK